MASQKQLPSFRTDGEAEAFVASADLAEYDLSGGLPVHYEFAPKDANISMRVPGPLLQAVKEKAAEQGIPYQRFIRQMLEQAVAAKPARRRPDR